MSEKTVLNVEGMTCTNCALGISRYLEKKGLKEVRVDFSSGEVAFEEVAPENRMEIVKGISKLGYKVIEPETLAGVDAPFRWDTLEIKFTISLFFTLPLIAHMFLNIPLLHNPVFQLILCTPVFLVGMLHFGKSAWASIKTGIPNMDVLITIGSVSAYVYSIAGMYFFDAGTEVSKYLFFETAATIITLVLLGNIIEKNSVKKTTTAIRDLAALQPVMANKITIQKDLSEQIEAVSISEIKIQDPVLVNTGGAIPVDGKIYWGEATVDESALTGESLPVEKSIGETVMTGSVLLSGSIKVVTEKAGSQTVLSNIISLVKEAQHSRPEIQKLGDRVSAWFVPAVLLIALLTFLIGHFAAGWDWSTALMNAVAVLVISCPCAMGLATPTAVAVGLGKAAKAGILVKGGATLELFDNIKTAVFDKTGTLTTGKFKIAALQTYNFDEQEAINILHSLEQHSEHPIAVSIVTGLSGRKSGWLSFEKVEEKKGIGVSASDGAGNNYMLGSYQSHQHLTNDNSHTIYLSKNNVLIATVDLRDDIKPGAAEMIRLLIQSGIQPVLLSGDNEKRCREVAGELNINTVYSNQLPHEKTAVIKALKQQGKLLMVGDGINDAPSLATADLGISFGEATKIAINSAQVIILNNSDLLAVINAIRIGKLTMTTIRQNLFWAFFYNVVAIPFAAMGYLSPMVAAFSMAFSDVIVIGNSIRLKFRN
ncbi:MAG: cation-translocating P-type ATPase [Bacteroidota bacterium]|nr:cation-translocating P-type ATPase [Bacteroidota bacterium]